MVCQASSHLSYVGLSTCCIQEIYQSQCFPQLVTCQVHGWQCERPKNLRCWNLHLNANFDKHHLFHFLDLIPVITPSLGLCWLCQQMMLLYMYNSFLARRCGKRSQSVVILHEVPMKEHFTMKSVLWWRSVSACNGETFAVKAWFVWNMSTYGICNKNK